MGQIHEQQPRTLAITPQPSAAAEPATQARPAQLMTDVSAGGIQALHAPAKAAPRDVRLALRDIERSATMGLAELEVSTPATRDAIVVKLALEVTHASVALVGLLEGLSAEKRSDFGAQANAATDAVNGVLGWISLRAPNAKMFATLDAAVRDLAPALRVMNVESIAARGFPVIKSSEVREATVERDAVQAAASNLRDAIDAETLQLISGVGAFSALAAIDDSSPPSFIEALATSLLIAATGHVFGEAMGAFLQHITTAPAVAVSKVAMERFVNVNTDTAQGMTGACIEARKAASAAKEAKARVYFVKALEQAAILDAKMRKGAITALVASHRAHAEVLDEEAKRISKSDAVRGQTYTTTAAHLWSLYRSQSTLGTHGQGASRDGHERGVTRMDEYFGVRNVAGDREMGTGHQGTHGVVRVHFDVTSGTRGLEARDFEIAGTNSTIAAVVAARGGNQLDQMELPKEVTVYFGHYRAVIAIDEKNRVRDSIGWEDIARASGHDRDLSSPQVFWAVVRNSKVGS